MSTYNLEIRCKVCGGPVPDHHVDVDAQRARCVPCGILFDFTVKLPPREAEHFPRIDTVEESSVAESGGGAYRSSAIAFHGFTTTMSDESGVVVVVDARRGKLTWTGRGNGTHMHEILVADVDFFFRGRTRSHDFALMVHTKDGGVFKVCSGFARPEDAGQLQMELERRLALATEAERERNRTSSVRTQRIE